jgi:hypothetical protein
MTQAHYVAEPFPQNHLDALLRPIIVVCQNSSRVLNHFLSRRNKENVQKQQLSAAILVVTSGTLFENDFSLFCSHLFR